MTCEDCARAHLRRWPCDAFNAMPRPTPADWSRFDPACLPCGARYLWLLQRSSLVREEKVERLRGVLATWIAHGHYEQQLRTLAGNFSSK